MGRTPMKNTQKHTQGPWRSNYPQITAQGSMALTVAVVLSREDNNPRADSAAKTKTEAEANAHLIAAAPDLLEEARLSITYLELSLNSHDYLTTLEHERLARLRALVAKAEGVK